MSGMSGMLPRVACKWVLFYKIVRNATKRPSQDAPLLVGGGFRSLESYCSKQGFFNFSSTKSQRPHGSRTTTQQQHKSKQQKNIHIPHKGRKVRRRKKNTHTQMATTLKAPLLHFFGFSRVQNATETHSRTLTEMCLIVELNCRFAQAGKSVITPSQVPRLTDRKACVLDRFHCLLSGWCERQAALYAAAVLVHTSLPNY